jgi:chromosome partitioning protein
MKRVMQTIVLHTPKGGAGKSLACREIAAAAAKAGASVAIADLDPQGTTTGWYKRRKDKKPALVSFTPDNMKAQQVRLAATGLDLFVVDTPPAYPPFISELLGLADMVLVPVRPTPDDLLASAPIARDLRRHPCWAFVLSQVPPRTRLLQSAIRQLAGIGRVAPVQITFRADYPAAAIEGLTAAEMTGKASAEAAELYAWITQTMRDTHGQEA